MANKRDLKRTINYITSELFAETVAASLYNGKPSQEDVDGILSAIVMINGDYISRVSHPEPGIKRGEYYKKAHRRLQQADERNHRPDFKLGIILLSSESENTPIYIYGKRNLSMDIV